MFVVHNTTDKTILLSDLRAEIPRRGILDLEKVAERDAIERSRDLQYALKTKRLQLGQHSVIHTRGYYKKEPSKVIEKETIIEKHELDEEKMAKIIRGILAEESKSQPSTDIKDEVDKAVKSSMVDLIATIRQQINFAGTLAQTPAQPSIDPAKLAEISQKSIDKVSKSVETNHTKQSKKIQFINTDLDNLANELE